MIIKVWHGTKHVDHTTTEIVWNETFTQYLKGLHEAGGLRLGQTFTPWHKINYIAVESDL